LRFKEVFMRLAAVVLSFLIPLGAWAQGGLPSPETVMEGYFALYRNEVFTASYVLTSTSTHEGEELFSLAGSLIVWMKYPWARVETSGLEDMLYPVVVADFERKVLYSHVPEEGWAKHVLSGNWLALLDPRYDPLLRRIRYTELTEDTLEGKAVWVVRGTLPPDPLGILPRAEVTFWIDKESYIDRKAKILFDIYVPGLDVLFTTEQLSELTSFKKVADIPADKFTVPPDAPAVPDLNGRVFPYPAPDLAGITVTGEELSLSEFSGEVVIVFFWDLGAEIEENIGLNLLLMEGIRERGEGKGVKVIGVTSGDPEIVAAFLEGFEAKMPTLVARDEWAEALGVTEETWCVVIDREGNVYAKADPFTVPALLLELLEPEA